MKVVVTVTIQAMKRRRNEGKRSQERLKMELERRKSVLKMFNFNEPSKIENRSYESCKTMDITGKSFILAYSIFGCQPGNFYVIQLVIDAP